MMNGPQRILLVAGFIGAASLIMGHYVDWYAANGSTVENPTANHLLVAIYDEPMVTDCIKRDPIDTFLACDADGNQHWTRVHGLWSRSDVSVREGFYVGLMVPFILIVAAGITALGGRKRV